MRNASILLLALLGGCYYDRPNPWKTESDRAEYRYKQEQDWLLEMETLYVAPQAKRGPLLDSELEAWRDTVLVNADVTLLERMKGQSAQKVATLQTRAYSMAPLNEDNKEQIFTLLWQARTEKIRLQLIDERLGKS
jgi:hypothetical protein